MAETPQRSREPRATIADALTRVSPWIADAELEWLGEGWAAHLRLEAGLASARACQQGFADQSVRGALHHRRVLEMIASYIDSANAALPRDCQIRSYDFSLCLEHGPTAAQGSGIGTCTTALRDERHEASASFVMCHSDSPPRNGGPCAGLAAN